MDYFGIVKRAAIITWKHKSMWLFGVLFALTGGSGRFSTNYRGWEEPAPQFERVSQQFTQIDLAIILAIVLFAIVLVLVMIFINFISQAAMIGMVGDVENSGETSVGSGFKHGWSRWARILGIALIITIPFSLIALILIGILVAPGIVALVAKKVVVGVVLLVVGILLGLVILIPTGIGVGLVNLLAERYCVIEKKGVFKSIADGWNLLRSNVGKTLLMWLIMLVVGMVAGIVAVVLGIGLMMPVILASLVNVWAAVTVALPFAVVFLFVMALISVFTFTAWTLFFLDLRKMQEETAPA